MLCFAFHDFESSMIWCIDEIGTVFGFLNESYIQSICYAVWEMLCSISVLFVVHILRNIRREFSHLMTSKMQRQSDRDSKRMDRKRAHFKERPVSQHRHPSKTPIHESQYISSDSMNCKEAQSTTNRSEFGKESTFTISDHPHAHRLISSAVSNVSNTTTAPSVMGSINESAWSETENMMKYEIARMRNVQIGLYLSVIVFLMNAVFNGLLRFYKPGQFWFFEETKDDLYTDTPTEIVAVVFFPQWT